MRIKLFDKANYLKDHTELVFEDDKTFTLQVGSFEVRFYYENHKLKYWCSCKAASLNPTLLCSHVIGGMIFMCKNGR